MTRRARFGRAALAALLLGALACGPEPGVPPAPAHTPDRVGTPPARLLVIVLDAAAASHFAWSGYPRQTTPRLDALVAERGFLFTNAHGTTSSVLPAAVSALTGQYPPGPSPSVPAHRLAADALTYPSVFAAAGFDTGGFSESPLVVEDYGFRGAFHAWRAFPGIRAIKSVHARPRNHPATDQLLGEATRWITARKGSPWLAYLHIMRPHSPYFASRPYEAIYTERWYTWAGSALTEVGVRRAGADANPSQMEYLIDLYDENLTSADAHVVDLIEDLEAKGALENTLVVVTSGHGEAFLEHGHLYHDVSIYDEVTRVPLLFLPPPGLEIAPGRSDARVELVDLFPTLVDLFRIERPPGLPGHSLVPLMRGGPPPPNRMTIAQTADATRFAFTRGDRKLILHVAAGESVPSAAELYDLAADPRERDDLNARGEQDAALRRFGEAYIARTLARSAPPNPPLTPWKRYELEVIGYLELTRDKSRGL